MTDHDREIIEGLAQRAAEVLNAYGPMTDAELAATMARDIAAEILEDGSLDAAIKLALAEDWVAPRLVLGRFL